MNTPPKERELFGTLLASTPQHTRSWRSLILAIAIHAALITIAIVTFKPFQTNPEQEQITPLSIVIVEEDAVEHLPNPFVRSTEPPAAATAERKRDKKKEEELVLRQGPLQPIVDVAGPPAPSTEEPADVAGRDAPGARTGGSLSDRLRPGYIDPRITSTTAFPPAEKTGAEAVRERILKNITAWNDSIADDAEIHRRDSDWTVKGKNGQRWGVSEEGLHLGKITIPAKAIAFTPPPGRRDEIAARVRDFNEIEKQAMLEESRSSFKDRVEAIRARKDRERAEQKRKTAETKPITELR